MVRVKEGLEKGCNHRIMGFFDVVGENVRIPDDRTLSLYAMAAVLPLLPAKQRFTDPNDWMTNGDLVMRPDPTCEAVRKITRIGVRAFDRADVTACWGRSKDAYRSFHGLLTPSSYPGH